MRNTSLTVFCLVVFLASCGEEYYTVDDFVTVPKIDTHVHLFAESPAYVEQAEKDNFYLVTVNVDVPRMELRAQEKYALVQKRLAPDRVSYVTTFSLQGWDSGAWPERTIRSLRESFSNGALGVKIWKNIGMVEKDSAGNFIMIDNDRFDPVVRYIIENDKTLLGHLGEPKNCWLPLDQMTVNNDRNYFREHPEYHMYLHPEYPSYDDQINARDRLLEKHPGLRFVGAHLGSLEWDVDELAKRLDRFPNMAVDMAARIPHLQHQTISNREKVRNFMIKYRDRLLYATDSGISPDSDPEEVKKTVHDQWMADWKYFVTDEMLRASEVNGEFRGLKLPRDVVDDIFRRNAIRWFRMTDRR